MANLSFEDFNALIGTVYEAALDTSRWSGFVEELGQSMDGAQIVMHGHDFVVRRHIGDVSYRLEPEFITSYAAHFAAINAWTPAMAQMEIGRVGVPETFLPRQELFRTEYYNDWLVPQELGTAAGIVLHRDASRLLILCGNLRLKDDGALLQSLAHTLDLLGPHIVRSFAMMRKIAPDAADYRSMFELSGHAVMMVDRRGRVVRGNVRADDLRNESSTFLLTRSGVLNFYDPAAQSAFERALGMIGSQNLLAFNGEFALSRRDFKKMTGSLIPMRPERDADELFHGVFDDLPAALLVLEASSPPFADFAAQFQLTSAEFALVKALSQGQSMQDYAEVKRTSIHTVRNQLKSIFQKTDTHRQSELVAKLLAARLQK